MEWYYANEGRRVGPVDDFEFEALIETGVIDQDTLVWNETLPKWARYGKIRSKTPQSADAHSTTPQPAPASGPATFARKSAQCHECGNVFPQEEMIRFQNAWVCANCKPIFAQKLREGTVLADEMVYAGFWIRFGAKLIDGLILGMVGGFIVVGVGALLFTSIDSGSEIGVVLNILIQAMSLMIGVGYTTYFLGRYGATPGKMMLGLKVVTSDGGSVSYARAVGRYFAEWLSAMILLIGYIMAAFDEEKRALHDRICDTRVIWKKR